MWGTPGHGYKRCLWIIVLVASVALVASTASAVDMTGTDASGQWSVTVKASDGTCGEDRSGYPVPCTRFEYAITANPAGAFPNQANVRIPICEPGSGFSIVAPTDRSVKIRDCDPNSGFVCDDLFADAITFDALKDLPNVQTDFSVAVTPASIEQSTLALVTGFGNVLVPTLGPGCCSKAQKISEVTYSLPDDSEWIFQWPSGVNSAGSLVASFNACSGDQTGDVYDPDATLNGESIAYTQIPGAYICLGDRTTHFKTTCTPTTKFGPVTGAVFYTTSNVYFGWGTRIWKGPNVIATPPTEESSVTCDPADTGNAPFPKIRTYANVVELTQDACGNLRKGKHLITGEEFDLEADYIPAASWFCEASANGRNSGVCSRIVTANIDDAIGDGTCRIWSGGRWLYFAGSCP